VTESTRQPRPWIVPLVLAVIVTLVNTLKPVVIDDTAFLAYARHIAAAPFNPYGFTIFWDRVPEPAFHTLAQPVLLYWLAIGIRLFGEHPALLKLWLFPFLWSFTWAVNDLLRRFAVGNTKLLPLIVLSPAVLPTVNLMLDVPALALGLMALASFARAADRDSWRLAVAAGFVAALASQTKYTMLAIIPAIAWYGFTHRRYHLAAVAVTIALVAFVGWELLIAAQYDHSYFWFHFTEQKRYFDHSNGTLRGLVQAKAHLASSIASHLGCLGIGVGVAAAGVLGASRRLLCFLAAIWMAGCIAIALVPYRYAIVTPASILAVKFFWRAFGLLTLSCLAGCVAIVVCRPRQIPRQADSRFLAGWICIQLFSCFAMAPIPAARRVIGLVVIGGFLVAHLVSRLGRVFPNRRPGVWTVAFGIAAGIMITVVDTADVFSEQKSVERAANIIVKRPVDSTAWCLGHWAFHYYCERAGMRPVIAGSSVLAPGDWLVLPVLLDGRDFGRPDILDMEFRPKLSTSEQVGHIVWNEPLSGQTVTNFYGGADPVMPRAHPRLGVAVYQIKVRTSVW
jgi:hypothetical protein